jgi:ankyrin repeat protein
MKGATSMSALHDAAKRGDTNAVRDILSRGTGKENRDEAGRTALHVAVECGRIGVTEFLLKRRASINARDAQGRTPLIRAVEAEQAVAVRFLLAHGANTNARDGRGWTALHTAARRGALDVAEALVLSDGFAGINIGDNDGRTALSYADDGGHSALADFLRRHAASEEGIVPSRHRDWFDRLFRWMLNGFPMRRRHAAR